MIAASPCGPTSAGSGPQPKWRDEIDIGLTSANAVACVITADWLASPECAEELDQAVEMGKRLVPVIHQEANGTPVPEALGEWNFVWLRDQDDFDEGVESLITARDTDIEWLHLHTKLRTAIRILEVAQRSVLRSGPHAEDRGFQSRWGYW